MMIPMMRPRTVVLIGALSLAAGWMVGTVSTPAQDPPVERRSGPRPLGVPAAKGGPYTEQLRQKLDEQPRSPVRGRNPFVFGSRRTPSAAPERTGVTAAEPEFSPAPTAPPVPMFRLSGVASTEKDGAVVLTAILIDNGSMVFAKAGDKLSAGHSVLRVEEKGVVIVDTSGVEQVLRLP
jgi:hypothetical protein